MNNFYEILGLNPNADATLIRAAYKRLALKYHPDRNPGFPEAEEIFKKINEAYHTLSDPAKRLNYDSLTTLIPAYAEAYKREMKRRRYWRYWIHHQERPYKLDREYFKIQGLAFLVFIVISGFCFAIIHTGHYVLEQRNLKRWNENSVSLKKINGLFGAGKFDDAFTLIQSLKKTDPYEFRFIYARDSLVSELKELADSKFNENDFSAAVTHYITLKMYEQPVSFETIRKIANCQFYLGNYKESLQSLKHLHNQRPRDLNLVYQIGLINLERLDNTDEALQYFNLGKKLFKENLSQVYGVAFELIVEPMDVPDIYFDIFEGRARCNLMLRHYNEAVTDGNWAVFLRPKNGRGYYLRAQAYALLSRRDRVCDDLYRAKMNGVIDTEKMENTFCKH